MDESLAVRSFQTRWLADGIGEDYKSWTPHGEVARRRPTRVFIESPSGSGKTAFVFDVLLPYAMSRGRSILYIGSRASLITQAERAARCGLQQRPQQADGALTFPYPASSACITLLGYQDILSVREGFSSYAYIIFDDAHFFVEDALFNARTGIALQTVLTGANDAVWVFLSSSLESVEAVLRQRADEILPSNYADNELSRRLLQQHCLTYRNTIRQGTCHPAFFRSSDDLLRAVAQTPREEKWLIFVSSVQQGKSLQRRIPAKAGRSAAFLSADSKNGRRWDTLVHEQRFTQDVLITTRVLDSGGIIADPAVTHVALPFCSKVEFLQMLGRRRLDTADSIRLYIEVPTIQKVNTLLALTRRKAAAIARVKRCPPQEKTALLQQMWDDGRQEINCLFYISRTGELTANDLAEEKLRQLETFYVSLAAHYREGGCYERQVLSWLGMENKQPRYLGEVAPGGINGFLSHCAGKFLRQEDCEPFYQEFQRLFAQECQSRFPPDSDEALAARSIRKGVTQRKATVNRQLRLLSLPYELKKEHNCWVLRHTDT